MADAEIELGSEGRSVVAGPRIRTTHAQRHVRIYVHGDRGSRLSGTYMTARNPSRALASFKPFN
jgi:hypothetical protein